MIYSINFASPDRESQRHLKSHALAAFRLNINSSFDAIDLGRQV